MGEGMSENSAPTRNKYERHERRIGRLTGCVRRVWYRISVKVGNGTHKILIDWPFKLLCRHVVNFDMRSHHDPIKPYALKEIEGYRNCWEWLTEHCKHGWWWQERGGAHRTIIHFRYKQDALQFKLIWG